MTIDERIEIAAEALHAFSWEGWGQGDHYKPWAELDEKSREYTRKIMRQVLVIACPEFFSIPPLDNLAIHE